MHKGQYHQLFPNDKTMGFLRALDRLRLKKFPSSRENREIPVLESIFERVVLITWEKYQRMLELEHILALHLF